jgi:hypothetical protein
MANGGIIGPVNDPIIESTDLVTPFTASGTFTARAGQPSVDLVSCRRWCWWFSEAEEVEQVVIVLLFSINQFQVHQCTISNSWRWWSC